MVQGMLPACAITKVDVEAFNSRAASSTLGVFLSLVVIIKLVAFF